MTQVEVAEKVGITQPSLQQLESGKSKKTAHAFELAMALKVSPSWLKDGTGEIDDAVAEALHGIHNKREMLDYAARKAAPYVVGEVMDGQPQYGQTIAGRLPLIKLSEASRAADAVADTEYSMPLWQLPGRPAPQYSSNAFALEIDTDIYDPALERGAVLFVDPGAETGKHGWCIVSVGEGPAIIAKAVPSLNPARPGLQSIVASHAPVETMPDNARIIGQVVYILPAY